jgi:hypothetical protein
MLLVGLVVRRTTFNPHLLLLRLGPSSGKYLELCVQSPCYGYCSVRKLQERTFSHLENVRCIYVNGLAELVVFLCANYRWA